MRLLAAGGRAAVWLGSRGIIASKITRLKRRVAFALIDATADLQPLDHELMRVALDAKLSSEFGKRGRVLEVRVALERDVRLLHVAVAIERGDLGLAQEELERAHADALATRVLRIRMRLAQGEVWGSALYDLSQADGVSSPLPEELHDDTVAQIHLMQGEVASALTCECFPLTRARALAAAGRAEEVTAIIRQAHPSRVGAMCRLYPEDKASRIALQLRHGSSPYR